MECKKKKSLEKYLIDKYGEEPKPTVEELRRMRQWKWY